MVSTASPVTQRSGSGDVAPTGRLRAGMNLTNELFTNKDAATGELRGVSVDIMGELARRLGVEVEFVVYATPGEVADDASQNTWDVAILAIEQARAEKIAFSPPMTEIEATYAVHDNSPLRSAVDADAAGVRIAVPDKAGYELYLTRTLRNATLVRAKTFGESIALFNDGHADALAGLRPALLESMDALPDVRLLEGNFTSVNHGLGTPRERSAAADYLKAFVEDLNATEFIARSIERHGIKGLSAIKPQGR